MGVRGACIAGGVCLAATIVSQYAAGLPQHLFIVQAKIRAAVWIVIHATPLVGIACAWEDRTAPLGRAMLLFHAIAAVQVWG